MEQKLASLFHIIAHAELEIDVIRASITKAAASDFQKVFNLMDSATRDAVSSFELARFLEARKVPAEQDEVRLIIQHYDIQRKGKWDLDTLQKALTPRSKGVQGAPTFGGQDANKELEAQLLKFFEKELDIIRATHPIRVQLYEGGASPVTALYKLLKKEKSEDITIAELTGVLRGTGVQMSDAEKTAVIQRADKEGKNSISYKEFEASILPDVTRKKVMERKVETTKQIVQTAQTTQVTQTAQVTQMTKSFPDKYTKMAEASEHLEVSFRAPQSTFQPTTTPLLNTDNVLRKETPVQETKPVSKTSQPFITSPYVSEYKDYSTKNEKVPETPDKYTGQSQKYQPAKTIPSYSSNTKEHNIPPVDTTLTAKFSASPEKELTPSFFGPRISISSHADQPKSYITPNPDLLHPTQSTKPTDNATLQKSVSSSTLVKSGLITTENKDPLIKGHVFASLLQPFETAEPKVVFQSAAKQKEQKEVLASQSFVSPVKSTTADTLSSSEVQQQLAPRLIKAKELYSSVTQLTKAPRETKYQNYEPSFASPSITRSSYQQSLYVTDRSFSLASKSSSSAFQTPVKEPLPESMMGSSDKLQKALEMLGSPLRSPRYVKFNEISTSLGLQSRKLFCKNMNKLIKIKNSFVIAAFAEMCVI